MTSKGAWARVASSEIRSATSCSRRTEPAKSGCGELDLLEHFEIEAARILALLRSDPVTQDLARFAEQFSSPLVGARLRLEADERLVARAESMLHAATRHVDGQLDAVAVGEPPRGEHLLFAEDSLAEATSIHRHALERLHETRARARRASWGFEAQREALRAALDARASRTGRNRAWVDAIVGQSVGVGSGLERPS
jgi:hypothetical protein